MLKKNHISTDNPKTTKTLNNSSFLKFILIIFILYGCRTLKESDYIYQNKKLFATLSPIKISIDIPNLRQVFSQSKYSVPGRFYGNLDVDKKNDSIYIVLNNQTYLDKAIALSKFSDNMMIHKIPDIRAYDIINYYTSSTDQHQSNSANNYYAHLKITSFEEKRNLPLVIFSAWTIGLSSIIGIPFNTSTTNISIELSLLNDHLDIIKKYKAKGKGRSYMALYWGYGKDLPRKSNLSAFNEALESISEQIAIDRDFIKKDPSRKDK